jgi:hypothetical protein
MRILLLLIVLAIIGLTLVHWLSQPPSTARVSPEATVAAPVVPTGPQELKKFEQDLNRFMQDAATQRNRQADPP